MRIANTRRRLLLGSALAVTSLFTYGRSAYAACAVTVSPTYECSGANVLTQSILNVTDATVSTLPGFSVNAAAGSGIEISGDGAVSFTDVNNSTITSGPTGLTTHGLDITGLGAGAGSVTVDTNSAITGAVHAISAVNNGVGALSITAGGNLTGVGGYGIFAKQIIGAGLQITTGGNAAILGSTVGIRAFHDGTGNMLIDTSGDVTGTANYGIDAINYANTTNLTINTGVGTSVTGGEHGIKAFNYGTGTLEIEANGDVTGTSKFGIYAINFNGTVLAVTTGVGTTVAGGQRGILAANFGTGVLDVTVNGDVVGTGFDGINASNTLLGMGVAVMTAAGTTVQGGRHGILARNNGVGAVLEISADGDVNGTSEDGINATNDLVGADITVATGVGTMVGGGENGIYARNNGSGTLSITTDGDVTGTNFDGVFARNYGTDLTVTTGDGAIVGGQRGILTRSNGSGVLSVTTGSGAITGSLDGINARSYSGTNLTVITGDGAVTGGNRGIFANNSGAGALTVNTGAGDVTGTVLNGILADNSVAGTDLTVTTGSGNVLGGLRGILAQNAGSGMTSVTVGGLVSNTSSNMAGEAIFIAFNAATIDNLAAGTIIGRITTTSPNGDTFNNAGLWVSSGTSDFGGGTNSITNDFAIITADSAGVAETTTFQNAGTFTNNAFLFMRDETAGNGSQAHDTLTIDGDFVGGGVMFMDAYLGGVGSTADLMVVTGNVSGVTQLQVTNTSAGGGGANLDGIALVQVNGTSAAGDFVLASGPISAGLFTYDLQFDAGNSVHELVSSGAATVSTELATFASAAQSIWYDTLGVLDDRFDELHKDMRGAAIIGDGTLVQPVSDNSAMQTGLWGKLIGRTSDRNAASSVGGVATDISYGLDTTGFVVGVVGANGSLALGLTGGYVNADQDFDSGSAANYEGFVGGLYATYVNGNFHVNGQFKANVLDLDYTMVGASGNSDADVVSLGAALEAGYRMDVTGNFYAEPVAQLAYVDSSTHNGDALGTAFTAEGDSLRGAIGLNLGGQINESGVIFKPELTLKVWGEFEGDNSASFSTFTVADNKPDVFGEAGLGIEALSLTNGWSGNLKGDIQFAEDFTSFGGFVGLRKNF